MNIRSTTALAVVLCAGLVACGTTEDTSRLSQKTVEYACGNEGEQPLTVQYTFQGQDPLAAKVILGDRAIDLNRDTSNKADMVGNTFKGNGFTWTTDKFNAENVGSVHGNMLTQEAMHNGQGASTATSKILAKECKVRS